jgi:hypothetical protein
MSDDGMQTNANEAHSNLKVFKDMQKTTSPPLQTFLLPILISTYNMLLVA